MKQRYEHMIEVLRQKPYSYLVFLLSGIYLVFIMSVYTYMYNGNPFLFYKSFPTWFTIVTSIFNVVISGLFGIILTLFIAKIKELRVKSAGIGFLGLLFGSLAAGCPGCFFGLFPVVLGLFGITATLAVLPLNGMELQIITILLMLLSIFFLAKETDIACELPKK